MRHLRMPFFLDLAYLATSLNAILSMSGRIAFRPAEPCDAAKVVALIRSSGPQAIAYGFGTARSDGSDFLQNTFVGGTAFFGWRNHRVALLDGEIAAVAAAYDLPAYLRLSVQHLAQVWRFFGARAFASRMRRGMQLQALMPAPGLSMHYLADFGVREDLRGRGIGHHFLEYQTALARAAGRRCLALDVSTDNPGAQALYARFGLQVIRRNRFGGAPGLVADTLRMEMAL